MRLSTKIFVTAIMLLVVGALAAPRAQAQSCEYDDTCVPLNVVAADTLDRVYAANARGCVAWIPATGEELQGDEVFKASHLDPIREVPVFGVLFSAYMDDNPSVVANKWSMLARLASSGSIPWSDAAWTIFSDVIVEMASATMSGDTLEAFGQVVTKDTAFSNAAIGPMLSAIEDNLKGGSIDVDVDESVIEQWPYSNLQHCVYGVVIEKECYPNATDFLQNYSAAHLYLDMVEIVRCDFSEEEIEQGYEIMSAPAEPVTVSPGEEKQIVWRIRNTGDKPWDVNYQLVHVTGGFIVNPSIVEAPSIAPAVEADMVVSIIAPQIPGTYMGRWQMKHAEDGFFGPVLTLELLVEEPQDTELQDGDETDSGGATGSASVTDAPASKPTCDESATDGVAIYGEKNCGGDRLELTEPGVYNLADEDFENKTSSIVVSPDWSALVSDMADGDGNTLCIGSTAEDLVTSMYAGTSVLVDNSITQIEVFDSPDCRPKEASGCAAVSFGGVILFDGTDCSGQGLSISSDDAYDLSKYDFSNRASSIFISPGWSALIAQERDGSGASLCVSATESNLTSVNFQDTDISTNNGTTYIRTSPYEDCKALQPMQNTPTSLVLRKGFQSLNWTVSTDSGQYQIQIDSSGDFAAPIRDELVAGSNHSVEDLDDGTYFWRIRGVDRDEIWSEWSGGRSFVLDNVAPDVPSQVDPANGTVVGNNTPTLTWTPVDSAELYHIQVDNDVTFASPEVKHMSGASQYTTAALSDGSFFWRVRARDVAGNWSEWSPKQRFYVETEQSSSGDAGLVQTPSDSVPLPITNTDCNLRSGPDTTYPMTGRLDKGAELEIVGVNAAEDWCRLADGSWIASFLVDNVPTGLPVYDAP